MCWLSHWLGWSLSTLGRSLVFSRSRFLRRGIDVSVMCLSDMVRGLVPSMVRCKGWVILSWWEDWFLPCQMWVLRNSDVTIGLVPTWLDISAECHYWNGGTWSITRKAQSRTEGHFDMTMGCSITWSDMSAWPFWCDWGMCSHLIRYKGCFISDE